jgi:hypothetical protein
MLDGLSEAGSRTAWPLDFANMDEIDAFISGCVQNFSSHSAALSKLPS